MGPTTMSEPNTNEFKTMVHMLYIVGHDFPLLGICFKKGLTKKYSLDMMTKSIKIIVACWFGHKS